jgi:hypothetical protein
MLKVNRHGYLRFSALFLIFFSMVFIAAPGEQFVYAWTCDVSTYGDLCTQYQAAVEDAAGPLTVGKLYNNLTPIVDENNNLIWKDGVIGSRLLVAAYQKPSGGNPPFSTCQVGVPFPKDCPIYGAYVTVAPELYNFFKKTPFSTQRIEQLLGLPPGNGADYIVEYWVEPRDLYRPAMDPQIGYREGTLRFPWALRGNLAVNPDPNYMVFDDYCPNVTSGACVCQAGQHTDYQCFFNNRRAWVYSYDLSGAPYPWTGLGYTYDWGNTKSNVGLSEFVISRAPANGSTPFLIAVQSVTVASDYFKRGQKATLTLRKAGDGKGKVTSKPGAVNCGPGCLTQSRNFAKYTDVTLIAKPSSGMGFYQWGGACDGSASATCTVTMSTDITATATFVGQ